MRDRSAEQRHQVESINEWTGLIGVHGMSHTVGTGVEKAMGTVVDDLRMKMILLTARHSRHAPLNEQIVA